MATWFTWKNWFKRQEAEKEDAEMKRLETATSKHVEELQKENDKLRRTVDSLLVNFGNNAKVGDARLNGLSTEDLELLKKLSVSYKEAGQSVEKPTATEGVSVKFMNEGELGVSKIKSTEAATSGSSSPVSSPSVSVADSIPTLDAGYKNAVFVKSAEKDQVAVVDMKNVEWWTIVDPSTLNEDDDKDITTEASDLGDSFAVVQQDDVSEAMANFLAVSIERHPDAKQLSPAELKKVLEGTLAQAKRQGRLSQAYGWGMWMYSSYSWGSYVVRIYKEPTLIKLVLQAACVLYQQPLLIPVFARGIWSAASWAVIAYL